MATLERSRTLQEGDLETSSEGAQLIRWEDLQDLVQSLVQRALADGGARQPPVAGNSGEQPRTECGNVQRLGSLTTLASLGALGPDYKGCPCAGPWYCLATVKTV